MDDSDTVGKSDVVYSSGEDGPASVLSERVSSLAAAIYAEFERMIQKHGQEVVSELMPLMVSVLEQLDAAYNDNNEQYVDLELLNDDNEQLLTQYEREKQLRKIAENKYLQVEDEHEQDKQEILKNREAEKHEKRAFESKIKSLSDHVQRTEERLNEKSRDYNSLHQRHSEMVHHFMERMERSDRGGRLLAVTPGGTLETPKQKRSAMRQENGAIPGLFNSISQPNLATAVSPTPQTPNGNIDVNLEESFDKKNGLSFEDESVVKVEDEDRKMTSVNVVEADTVNHQAADAIPIADEARTVTQPMETVAIIKENDKGPTHTNSIANEQSGEIKHELNASAISSRTSSDSDASNVKTCNISDISHVPIVSVQDVQNLIVSPKSKSESGSESMFSELSPDVRAILSSTPELESSVTQSATRNPRVNKGSKDNVRTALEFDPAQEFVNTNSLFAELSSQEPSAIGEIDEGAEISVMGKELESVLKENEELVKTKSKLLTQKNDLLNRIEEISSENEMLKDETKMLQGRTESLSTKGESYEQQQQEIKRLKHELDKSTMALKEANVSAAHRKRFSRVEMARVLMERNQYKERLMELQEAVRWTEMIRASKEKSLELQQKKKSWVWKLFSGLFNTAPKKPNPSPVSIKSSSGSQAGGTVRPPSDSTVETSPGVVDSQVDRQRLMEKRTRMKQLRASISSGMSEGRMQAYGWSLPARYSTEGANGSKGLVSVPVPIYCRPLNISEPGMKIWCATVVERRSKDGGSPIGGSVFYAESCRESSSTKDTNNSSLEESSLTTLWIGSSTHSCSKITVIDGNSPQKVLECFVLCSSHLLCIAAVPGVSEDDFDDNTKENDESTEISYDSEHENVKASPSQRRRSVEASDSFNSFNKTNDSLSTSELIDPLEVKPKAVCGDQVVTNGATQDGNNTKLAEGPMDKVSTMLPTVWFGAQSGTIYIHSAICDWKRCLHSIKLRDSVLSIVHIRGKVLIALADGTVAIFRRKPDGQWDVRNYHLLDLGRPHHSIRCMTVVHDSVWCGYRNKIQVINPQIMRIVKSFDAHPRRESQVRQLSCIGDGVWVSIRLDSTLRLYNAHTYHHLQDVDIEPCVSSLIGAGKLGFSFVRITALMLTKDRMWVGTGNGVVLSIPLVAAQPESSRSVVTTPTDNGGPGGVVRVYTDTMEKGGEKSGVSSFMPYCSMVGIDLIGPLKTSKQGNSYIATMTDYFSKWPEAQAIPNKSAKCVSDFLFKMILRYGSMDIVISDQGREFVNQVNNELFARTGVDHRITSAYHPQTNGLTERFNQTLENAIVKVINEDQDNWEDNLESILFCYRSSKNDSTKFSPFFLMYGREPKLPIELAVEGSPRCDDQDSAQVSLDTKVEQLLKLKKSVHDLAMKNIGKAQDRQKRNYDKKHDSTKINAHISFHGHRDSVKFFVTVPGSMDKASSVSSPKLSTSTVKAESALFTSVTAEEERSWLVISGGEGYIDFRTGDNIEGGENIGGPEDIPSSSKMSSAENSHIMVWQVTGD